MSKWNPVYRVTVFYKENGENKALTVMLPLTCDMHITRSILSQNTSANIQIYNLSAETRKAIDQPPFQALTDNAKYITVEAGYGDEQSMYMIFKGYILEAYSSKTGGGTDIITDIHAQALDLLTSYSSKQFAARTSNREILSTLAADLPNCSIGNIGAIAGEIKTATTFEGNTLEQINKIAGGCAFIDNGQLNCILSNEVIDVPVPVITDNNALLETPKRSAANLTIKMLFEPSLVVGQLLEIKSGIIPDYNGQYKILGFTHDLHFSGSTDGQRTTSVELWYGKNLQNSPIYVSGDKVQETFNKVKKEDVSPVEESKVNVKWIMPLNGVIRGQFGEKRPGHTHKGVDIAVPIGTSVKAVADGTVVLRRHDYSKSGGYGYYIIISHGKINGKNVYSVYGHLSSYKCVLNQRVKQEQIIALSGNSGYSQGPHLHFEVREGSMFGTAVNSSKYVSLK